MFKEEDEAEIKVKEIELKALEEELKKVKPLVDYISVEVRTLKDDIKLMREKLYK